MEQGKKLKKKINPLLFFLIIFSISAPFWLLGQFVKYDGPDVTCPFRTYKLKGFAMLYFVSACNKTFCKLKNEHK